MQLLELPAPGAPVAGRDFHLLADLPFGIGNEGAEIAPLNIGADYDAALAVFATDLVRARSQLQFSHFG